LIFNIKALSFGRELFFIAAAAPFQKSEKLDLVQRKNDRPQTLFYSASTGKDCNAEIPNAKRPLDFFNPIGQTDIS
jgi:hypothetical protein